MLESSAERGICSSFTLVPRMAGRAVSWPEEPSVRPFSISADLATMRGPYPPAEDIVRVCGAGGTNARLAVARLWLSEGIPFAFRDSPGLYEYVRVWLASRLNVDPKEITLVGSGRIGQSLAPKKLGVPFSQESDLDLTTVSSSLFERLATDFNTWASDFETATVTPSNDRERRFWDDNLTRGTGIIGKGFINSMLIPRYRQYPCAQQVGQTMYLLCEKLKLTPGAPQVRSADIRAYRNWDAYARQMATNLGGR